MMKKKICSVLLALSLAAGLNLSAQDYGDNLFSVGAGGFCAYNTTYGVHGGVAAKAFLPLYRDFESAVALEWSGSSVFAADITARYIFPIGRGELFSDLHLHTREYYVFHDSDLLIGLSLGYRRDYFSLQVGTSVRYMFQASGDRILEPWIPLYKVSAFVRDSRSPWNLGLTVANYTDCMYGRPWDPVFSLVGRVNLSRHLRIDPYLSCAPAGMFHLAAASYGYRLGASLTYLF